MKIPFALHRRIAPIRRQLEIRDHLRSELNSQRLTLDAERSARSSEREEFTRRIAELEASRAALEASIPKVESDEFFRMAVAEMRRRYAYIREQLPVTTSAIYGEGQLRQDLFVLESTGFKRGGYFLEIGVGPGREYSNTHLLEKTFGWKGILCEPNPFYADSIRAERSVIFDTRAAYSTSGEILQFLCVPDGYGVLSTLAGFETSDRHSRWGKQVTVTTVSLTDLLVEHGAPEQIDYLSLDTEGSESLIMRPFDFNRWDIRIMTIEHNRTPGRVEEFDSILLPFGYRRVLSDITWDDAWYVRDPQ